MRLCMANRFTSAASMSFCRAVANTVGSHFDSCHWFVQAGVYSRAGLGAEVLVPTVPLARLSHFSVALAELPTEVLLGAPVFGSMSHATPPSAVATVFAQPRRAVRHHVTRVSRDA